MGQFLKQRLTLSDKPENLWRAGNWQSRPGVNPRARPYFFPALVIALGLFFWFTPRLGVPDQPSLQPVEGIATAYDHDGTSTWIRLSGSDLLFIVASQCSYPPSIVPRIASSRAPLVLWTYGTIEHVKGTGEPYRKVFAISSGNGQILSYAACEQSMIGENKMRAYALFAFAAFSALIGTIRYRRAQKRLERDAAKDSSV
jgi:hypothetical protein